MDQNAKQQTVEYLKQANNVLVTVSANPSVDQLSAALGFTLILNKLNKHATAVVSGIIPPAITFLEPNKTFSSSVDGLRDFIIALDKEKADKLRYKVEDDAVRIFITPYQGEITKDDLRFSQGDFNVDVVVALGVTNREDLDNAIKAHGRILHDATVLTINAGNQKSSLGAIDWQDISAGSLSEMIVSISEAFAGGLLDAQISTALLTGIVSATERFSNNKTSPKIMTMAAQLMAAGANQQLIANHLNVTPQVADVAPPLEAPQADSSELKLDHSGQDKPLMPPQVTPQMSLPGPEPVSPPPLPSPVAQPAPPTLPPLPPTQPVASPQAPVFPQIQTQPQQPAPPPPPPPASAPPGGKTLTEIEKEIADLASPTTKKGKKPLKPVLPGSEPPKIVKTKHSRLPDPPEPKLDDDQPKDANSHLITNVKGVNPTKAADKPLLGGTFNATSDVAHDETEKELTKDVNR
ncbi:MAG: hypothetical protein R3313_02980, partial [Candidatus Saccharimonadales bacterium]|nr:hypothetical protein [Candidatus Saccharimonadales bacterium]